MPRSSSPRGRSHSPRPLGHSSPTDRPSPSRSPSPNPHGHYKNDRSPSPVSPRRSPVRAGSVSPAHSRSPRRYSRSRSASRDRRRSSRRSRSRSRSSHRRHRRRHSRSHSRSPARHHRRHHSRERPSGYNGRRSPPRVPRHDRRDPVPTSNILGVFGLNTSTTESDLEREFCKFGRIESIKIIYDHSTGTSRGFGFIYFESDESATDALRATNGMRLMGNEIRVDYSATKGPHQPTPGRYMGRRSGSSRMNRRRYDSRSPRRSPRRYSRSRSR